MKIGYETSWLVLSSMLRVKREGTPQAAAGTALAEGGFAAFELGFFAFSLLAAGFFTLVSAVCPRLGFSGESFHIAATC